MHRDWAILLDQYQMADCSILLTKLNHIFSLQSTTLIHHIFYQILMACCSGITINSFLEDNGTDKCLFCLLVQFKNLRMGQCSLKDLVGLLLMLFEAEGFIDQEHQFFCGFYNLQKIIDINILIAFPRSLTYFKAKGIELNET